MTRTANATEKMKRDSLIAAAAGQGGPILCAICGKPILPGQRYAFDHGHALGRGGPNTVDNLFPVHDDKDPASEFNCHTRKTAHPRGPHTAIGGDTFEAAKTDRLEEARLTPAAPGRPWPSRPMQSAPFPQRKQAKAWPKRRMRGRP